MNGKQNDKDSAVKYLVLSEFFKGRFLKNNNPEIIIETCLLAITIVSYLVPKRIDLINALNQMICRNLDLLLEKAPLLVQARMSLFLGYF